MKVHFEKLVTLGCERPIGHLPHIWYSPNRLRRYFCKGEGT